MLSAGERGGSGSSEDERFPVRWVPRDHPLRPIGVAAVGQAAVRLVERLRLELARAGSAPPAPAAQDHELAAAPVSLPPSPPGPQDPPAPSASGQDSNAEVSDSSAGASDSSPADLGSTAGVQDSNAGVQDSSAGSDRVTGDSNADEQGSSAGSDRVIGDSDAEVRERAFVDPNAGVQRSKGLGLPSRPPRPAPPNPAQWRGVGGPGWIVLVGDDPPWVDGAVFLGRDPLAPRLLLPTHSAPEAAGVAVPALLDQWAAAKCGERPGPYAVVPGLGIVPLGAARPVDAEGLGRWRAG